MEKEFYVSGYNAENNTYTRLVSSPVIESVIIMTKALTYYHMSHRQIADKNGRVFDAFAVIDNYDNVLKMFTKEHPDGMDPNSGKKSN